MIKIYNDKVYMPTENMPKKIIQKNIRVFISL